ncbi:MAG TPA: hypothetical protein VFD43_12395 [Planctomycetota bacterium]|nr:hypothetical protein [Planctomycetota bacterium]
MNETAPPDQLTLRDHFAGAALTALLPVAVQTRKDSLVAVAGDRASQVGSVGLNHGGVRWAIVEAYAVADAVLQYRATLQSPVESAALPGPGSNGRAGA